MTWELSGLGCWASQAALAPAGASPESSTAAGAAHRSSFMAQKQDYALTGLEAHYPPFVNCQQEAVTLAGHLNNPLKNKIKWQCWSIIGHSASRLLALAFAFLVPSYKPGFCWFHSQLLVSSHSQECLTTHSRVWEICCIKTAIKVKENKACENKQAAPLIGNPT